MPKFESLLCPFCSRKNSRRKTAPKSAEGVCNNSTEVTIDDGGMQEVARPWNAARVFSVLFHATPDSKLALKLFGNEKSLLQEKKRQENGSLKWMIHPYSNFRYFWDFLIAFLLIFTVIVLPVSIAFYSDNQMQPEWLTINIAVDLLFFTDIFVNFRTGFIVKNKQVEVVLSPRKVALHYARTWFIIDFLSALPSDYLVSAFTSGEVNTSLLKASRALRFVRVAKFLSLLKLLRVSRILRFMQTWEEISDVAGGMFRIMKLVMLMLLLAHWNGCIQFLVPVLQEIPRESWIAINRLQNATVGEQYTWALFKAISHMLCIGFGRWPPQNVTETWLTIISMVVGATFYALFIGNVSSLLLSIDSSGRLYSEKLSQVEEYMRHRKLPQYIRDKVTEYYEHRFKKKFFDENSILAELSKGLRESIISYNCRDLMSAVPFFHNASPQFISAVLTKLKFEVFLKGEYIIHEGDIGTKMYFILSGVVSVLNKRREVKAVLSDGSHFGEICLLTHDRQVATVRADTVCDTFSLSKKNFEFVLKEYPAMKCALEAIAQNRLVELGKRLKSGRLYSPISPPSMTRGSNTSLSEDQQEEQSTTWNNFRRLIRRLHKRNRKTHPEDIKTSLSEHSESTCFPATSTPLHSPTAPPLSTSTPSNSKNITCEHNEANDPAILEALITSSNPASLNIASDSSSDSSELDSSEDINTL